MPFYVIVRSAAGGPWQSKSLHFRLLRRAEQLADDFTSGKAAKALYNIIETLVVLYDGARIL